MPRPCADTVLSTRAARERLAARHRPYWRGIDGGSAIGYRKGSSGGIWLVRTADATAGGGYRQASLGRADDTLNRDGAAVLDFRAAEAAAREWIARQNRIAAGMEPEQDSTPAAPYTVAAAMADYLADYGARGGKGLPQTRCSIDAHILPALGALAVSRLTRDRIRTWHRALATAPARVRAKAGTLATRATDPADAEALRRRRSTANRVLTILKAALNYARAEGKAGSAEAWSAVKAFREADSAKIAYLTDAETTRLINACPADLRAIVTGALLTGCRYGELAGLKVGDVDTRAGTVAIAASKGGKPRHVVLTAEGRAFFGDRVAGRATKDRVFQREAVVRQASKQAAAVMRTVAWAKSDQFRPLREACEAAKIEPAISFHVLRHTYASRLAARGAPMAVISAQLGHADLRMTTRHYAHLAPSYVAETVRAVFGDLGLSLGSNVVALAG